MNNLIEMARRHAKYFHLRDEQIVRDLLHAEYRFVGPGLELHGPDASIEFMRTMPLRAEAENSRYISDGERVVHQFDLAVSEPDPVRLRMCEVVSFEDDKIIGIELYYDSADLGA